MKKFLHWLCDLEPNERIVSIISWRPSWGMYGIEWPTLKIEHYGYRTELCAPVWDRTRIVNFFKSSESAS